MTRSPPLSTEEEGDVVTTAAQIDALTNGALRFCTTGQISVSSNLNILLENPSGSGVAVTLFAVVAANDAGQVTFPTLHKNPTTDLPTTSRTVIDANLGTENPSAVNLLADDMSNEMSGGSMAASFGTEGGRTEMPVFFQLAPGTSMGVSNPFGGITSANASFTGWFIEKPL